MAWDCIVMDVWVGVEIGIGIVTARAEHGPDMHSVTFSCIEYDTSLVLKGVPGCLNSFWDECSRCVDVHYRQIYSFIMPPD